MIPSVVNHLWQSTAFAAVAWTLTLALRNNRAAIRYGIWLAASLKFLVPFALLAAIGARIPWQSAPVIHTAPFSGAIQEFAHPFPANVAPLAPHAASPLPFVLTFVWVCGIMAVTIHWLRQWQRTRSSAPLEPAAIGIFRPIVYLPAGIAERLTPAQLQAILAHEFCHIRRRDNLWAAIHMMVEATLWFHPLVWWIGARLLDERERACDEAVLAECGNPQAYAEGILAACRFYLESPVACVSGVTGSDLHARIAEIMSARPAAPLNRARRALLAGAAAIAFAAPLLTGLASAPARAQSAAGGPAVSFEVASVKRARPGQRGYSIVSPAGGQERIRNATLKVILAEAYQVHPYQLTGAPKWIDTARYDIDAKATDPRTKHAEILRMLQSLLAERFHLVIHHDTRDLPTYSLVVGKGGAKLDPPKIVTGPHGVDYRNGGTQLIGRNASMDEFADALSFRLEHSVIDHTSLRGGFDFKLEFSPDEFVRRFSDDGPTVVDPEGISIFTAIQHQLGLKLESGRGPVKIIAIDRIEEPTEN